MKSRSRVAYFYDEEIGNFYYGAGHPMKPHRIRMTHNLVLNYGLYKKMEIYRPHLLSEDEISMFHSDDYVHFLKFITPDKVPDYQQEILRYNVDVDCPVFDGLFKFCQLSSGGSVGGAYKLNRGTADICVNWAGGLHHAKKSEASGFCYVNDIVLAILELLKYHQRVLYIDIDIHHGDGVEEAFYTTDRVMTVSFHKYGEYFPGTGALKDTGYGRGKNYSLNFPLMDGIDDQNFEQIFSSIIGKVMESYRPGAIVLQCGADSLSGDRLGCFNLSLKGHGSCVEFVKQFGVPLLVLGGGGYTVRNVARCWAYETGLVLDERLQDELPYNDYYEYFAPDFTLHIQPSNMENQNTARYLDEQRIALLELLRSLPNSPSVQYTTPRPHEYEREDPDVPLDDRNPQWLMDKRANQNEYYSDDKDQDSQKKFLVKPDAATNTNTAIATATAPSGSGSGSGSAGSATAPASSNGAAASSSSSSSSAAAPANQGKPWARPAYVVPITQPVRSSSSSSAADKKNEKTPHSPSTGSAAAPASATTAAAGGATTAAAGAPAGASVAVGSATAGPANGGPAGSAGGTMTD